MLYIISGPSSVGKSLIVNRFITKNGFNRIVPFTSREIRKLENETEGIEYYFRTKDEIKQISKNFSEGYWDYLFDNYYGYSSEVIQKIDSTLPYIILATSKIATSIKRDFPGAVIIFIDFETETELEQRIRKRFSPDSYLIDAKLLDAKAERQYVDCFDFVYQSDDPNVLYDKIVSKILK